MRDKHFKLGKHVVNRRAFLRGAGGVAIGLPFLEGLPERSAWAQNAQPTFVFFIVAANGTNHEDFWPSAVGPLTTASMQADVKSSSELAEHAANLLMVSGINVPGTMGNCGHAQGSVQALTGVGPNGGGQGAQSTGISADMVISNELNPDGVDPLTLYAGKRYYIAERISFSGAGTARSAELNPFNVYRNLIGLAGSSGGMAADPAEAQATADELIAREVSINDYVREDLQALLGRTDLSAADRTRLELHLSAVREIETGMAAVASLGCEAEGLNVPAIEAMERLNFSQSGNMIEDVVKLHMELVAFAFACNANRVATLQWGDGTDGTVYDVPSNSRRWSFHHISHRAQSDGSSGNDQTAVVAHGEIDVLRMQTLKHGLDQFAQRGLFENSALLWTSHISDGPTHSGQNLPYIIAGSAGGFLKQGEYIDVATEGGGGTFGGGGGGTTNPGILTTMIHAAGGTGNVGDGADQAELLA